MFGWLASRGLENVLFSDEICSSSTKITICNDLGWNVDRHHCFFVPNGIKVNATNYRVLILEPVVKSLGQTLLMGPAHTTNAIQDWLSSSIPGFISKVQLLPYYPDLNPMDYSIWSILESNACNRSHKSIESLKRSLVQEWENPPGGPMCRCRRLGRENIGCHQNTGRYIEYQILL